MASHVKVLGWLYIIFSAFGVLAGLFVFLIMGGIAGVVGATGQTDDRVIAMPILGGIGGLVFIILLILSLPGLIGGIGLIQFRPWSRILMIVISALHLLGFPFGTAIGIYGLWVLLNRETEALFQRAPVRYAPGPYSG